MRDTGPIAKTLTGDQDSSVGQISVARTQLGILKNQMQLGGTTQGSRSVTLPDGTHMRVTSINGIDQVHITTAQPTAATPVVEEVPEFPIPQPPEPPRIHVPQPDVGGLAFYAGYLNQNDGDITFDEFSYIPLTVNGVQVNTPNGQAFVMNKGTAFSFSPSVGVDPSDGVAVFPTSSILANVSPEGAVLAGQQPAHQTDWTWTSEFGKDLSSNIIGADQITASGWEVQIKKASGAVVTVPQLSSILLVGTLVSVNYKLVGKLPSGGQLKSGFVIAKSIWPFVDANGFIADPTVFPVYDINGAPPHENDVGAPVSNRIDGNIISQAIVEITRDLPPFSGGLVLEFGAIDELANTITGPFFSITSATYSGGWAMTLVNPRRIDINSPTTGFGTVSDGGVLTVIGSSGETVSYNIALSNTFVQGS